MRADRPILRVLLGLAFSFTLVAPKLSMPCCNGDEDADSHGDGFASECCDSCIGEGLVGALTIPDGDSSKEPAHPATDCKGCSAVCCVKVTAVQLKPAIGLAVAVVRSVPVSSLEVPEGPTSEGIFHPPRFV